MNRLLYILTIILLVPSALMAQAEFRLEHSVPSDGSRDIALNTYFEIYFSKDIDPLTLTGNIALKLINGTEIPVSWTTSQNYVKIQLIPPASLTPLTEYHLEIGANIRDISGTVLGETRTISFISKRVLNPVSSLTVYPNPCKLEEIIRFQYQLERNLDVVELKVYSRKRRFVHSLSLNTTQGVHTESWDFSLNTGHPIQPGLYYLKLTGIDSSGIRFEKREKMVVLP